MADIVPAILPKTFAELKRQLSLVRGLAPEVQIDIVDGKFAPSKTWPYVGDEGQFAEIVAEEEGLPFWREFEFELDLMVSKPAEVIGEWVKAGASRILIHLESIEPDALTDLIREWKHVVAIGLALNPSTPSERLEMFAHEVGVIQCMGNDRVGFQGVPLDERVYEKVAGLRKRHPEHIISVDIGVSLETAPRLIAAGANRLIAGSAIFQATNIRAALEAFKAM